MSVCFIPLDTVPNKLKRGRAAQRFCMTFIQLLVYLRLAKVPFAARGLFEPHREKQNMLLSSIIIQKSTV